MPTQGTNPDDEPYCTVIGPESNQKLVFAETENWAADQTAKIVCGSPVDLAEWQ
jgi:hypothetical protein